jgi:TonB family protein
MMFLLLPQHTLRLIALGAAMVLTIAAQSMNGAYDRDRAIVLVQQGNTAEAIVLLKSALKQNKRDIRAWHWLGTALEKQQEIKDATKAHEMAATTAQELQDAALENLKSLSTIELTEAADSAERYLALNSSLSDKKRKEWRDRAGFFRLYATSTIDPKIYKNSEVTARARVFKREEPAYTDDARKNLVTGTVVLRCIFAADGRVRNIKVIKGLPNGLTERAIEAARLIKFIPATKDGKPVSMWMQLEYNFDLGIVP